jgi:predicted amino acid racemase
MYPLLEVNLNKIQDNMTYVSAMCKENHVSITGVIKGCAALEKVTQAFIDSGCNSIGSSRISQLETVKQKFEVPTMLLRIPMLDEIPNVISYSDVSLNSEKTTIDALNQEACIQNKIHEVILMYDLGDLREGLWDFDEMVKLSGYVEKLSHIRLLGIGTNIGCYGSVKPTVENMSRLVRLAEKIEREIKRKLDVISGGATSSLTLVANGSLPKRVNHLRLGESLLLGRDLGEYYNCPLPLHDDTFILKAQVIELKEKPSYPLGELVVDAFGNKPDYKDVGIQKRGIIAVGKQDFGHHEKLIPVDENVKIIGSSSDHLIVDMTQADYAVGSIVAFEMYYQPMLYLSLSRDVKKKYVL